MNFASYELTGSTGLIFAGSYRSSVWKCCVLLLWLFARCTLRFPSTNVKITFQALQGSSDNVAVTSSPVVSSPSPAKPLQPLHISIPKSSESVSVFASPCPSPTGTIRFAVSYLLKPEFLCFALFYIGLLQTVHSALTSDIMETWESVKSQVLTNVLIDCHSLASVDHSRQLCYRELCFCFSVCLCLCALVLVEFWLNGLLAYVELWFCARTKWLFVPGKRFTSPGWISKNHR